MLIIELIASVLVIIAIILLFRLTPTQITEDVLKLLYREQSLGYQVKILQGRKKRSKIRMEIMDIYNALRDTKSLNKFTFMCSIAFVGYIISVIIMGITGSIMLGLALIGVGIIIPYAYAKVITEFYFGKIKSELETALSIITTSYISSEDIISAVENNIDNINEPVKGIFKRFLGKTKLISSDVKQAIIEMRDSVNDSIFYEWCTNLIECQDDHSLRLSLQPIVTKMSDERIVNEELKTELIKPRNEFFCFIAIVLAFPFLLLIAKRDWGLILLATPQGHIALAITLAVSIFGGFRCFSVTRPISFKR